MLNPDQLKSELELLELLTAGFVNSIVRAAKLMPEDKWNWSISERTPTAKEICEHAFMWLWCDRQQMSELDRSQHRPIPKLPNDKETMINMLQEEAEAWRVFVKSLNENQLGEERESWPGEMRNLRAFFFHMGQHVIYKAGQIWMLCFELGLDGDGLYTAPHPNEIYEFRGVAKWPAPRT